MCRLLASGSRSHDSETTPTGAFARLQSDKHRTGMMARRRSPAPATLTQQGCNPKAAALISQGQTAAPEHGAYLAVALTVPPVVGTTIM
jgi:hypothetical protein